MTNFTEIFFYSKAIRGSQLNSVSEEVAALRAGTWQPSSVDFRAISIRSAGGKNPRADAEVSTVRQFLTMLAEPASRFNFFGYLVGPDELNLDVETGPNQLSGAAAPDLTDPDSPVLARDTITALREVGGLSTGGGQLADLVRAVRRRNAEFEEKEGEAELRQLWLAVASGPPTDAFAADLAKALLMEVVIYPEKIVFRPDFRASPPRILKRGVIEIFGETTSDLHTFDHHGIGFSP